MPFSVLLEVALQPCGWLAAYVGSAFASDEDLRFRNLGGKAKLLNQISAEDLEPIFVRAELTNVAKAGGMIVQDFSFHVRQGSREIYRGVTNFGFFTQAQLSAQVGIRRSTGTTGCPKFGTEKKSRDPLTMLTQGTSAEKLNENTTQLWGKKPIDPNEWFFSAHFYEDPVMPGSLGLEAFLELVAEETGSSRVIGDHEWIYRGQVTPKNQEVVIEALIKKNGGASPIADGRLFVDGLEIYQMKNFTIDC